MFLSTPHTKAQREAYRVHIWESAPPYTGGMGLCVIAPVVPYDRPDLSRAPRPIFSLSDLVFSGQSRYFARQPEVTDGFSWQSASACRSSLHATCSADYVHARRSGEPPRTLIRAGPRRHMPCFFLPQPHLHTIAVSQVRGTSEKENKRKEREARTCYVHAFTGWRYSESRFGGGRASDGDMERPGACENPRPENTHFVASSCHGNHIVRTRLHNFERSVASGRRPRESN